MPFLYIALSVACSLTIAHLLKKVRHRKMRVMQVLTVNYLVAVVISLSTNTNFEIESGSLGFIPLAAALVGVIFIANLFVYSSSIHQAGLGISISAMRLSLVIPIGISLIWYKETLGLNNYLGIGAVFIAFYLLLPKTDRNSTPKKGQWLYPIILFLFTGIADGTLKVYDQEFSAILSEEIFLSMIFASSLIIGSLYLIVKKEFNFSGKEIFYGVMVGIANLYSSFFLLLALRNLSGALVFSLVNISNVLIGTLIGITIWNDQLSNQQKTGIALAAVSILLLVL